MLIPTYPLGLVIDVTLDDRELDALPLPFLEPTLRPGFLWVTREIGVTFFRPVFGVGVGDLEPPREDAGVDKRDPFREFGVSERSLRFMFRFLLFLVANISLASSSSAAAASAACARADLDRCLALVLPDMTQTLSQLICVSPTCQQSSAVNVRSQHLRAVYFVVIVFVFLSMNLVGKIFEESSGAQHIFWRGGSMHF